MNTPLRSQIVAVYRKRAKHYDVTANLYYLLGYREWAFRRRAVRALNLRRSATVIEVGCGTGLNFTLYQEAIGPDGRIIGVDLTDAMLTQARKRIAAQGWTNVDLVQGDALVYEFPADVDGIISTFAFSHIPETRQVVEKAVEALAPGGRMVVLDLQVPESWPSWLVSLGRSLVKPFAVTDEWFDRKPWAAIQSAMTDLLRNVSITEMYMGVTYLIVGEKG